MKFKVLFVSERGYPVTDVMMRASQAEAAVCDAEVTEDQVKVLLDLGLPRSLKCMSAAISAAQIDELAASRMLEAAVAVNIASRPWFEKLWQVLLCATSRHKLEPALAHPDLASAEATGCTLHECPYCERAYVYEFGRGWYDFSPNTKLAEHRDRVKLINAHWEDRKRENAT